MKKKSISSKKLTGSIASPELQRAIDAFPKAVKLKEKAARERKRIMKNFMSVKDKIYK